MNKILLRYSSLGDVVLAASITAACGPVGFVTEPRYAPLVRQFPGVVRVYSPDERLPAGVPVVDLQSSRRSARVAAVRIDRQDWRRWGRVIWKGAPADRVVDRYARAAGVVAAAAPWLPPAVRGDVLLLAPGAAHATKRWPHWEAFARAWPGPIRALGGPGDAAILRALGGAPERGFADTLAAMNGGAALVAGDTGLLHLAAAVGLPVVGLFGPTTSADGFWCHAGVVVERPMFCRPCSKFGGTTCPVGDHACMRELSVADVVAAVHRALATL